jgi:hypothetical protein
MPAVVMAYKGDGNLTSTAVQLVSVNGVSKCALSSVELT